MKKWMSMLLVGGLALGLLGCGAQKEEPKADTDATYKVGVLSIDDSLPFHIAQEEGFFKDAGVNVEVIPFKSSAEESQALEAGELDMVMNDMVIQGLLAKAGTNTKIVATAFGAVPEEGRFVVCGAPGKKILKPEELYGKKVAISTNTMMEYLMQAYFEHLGLDISKVELVNMPNLGSRLEALLAAKDIDAAILPDPLASLALAQSATSIIDDTKLGDNFSQSVILASDKAIGEKTEATGKVLGAVFRAMDAINENPEKYLEQERAFSNIPQPLQETYPMPRYTPKSVPTKEQAERVQNWLVAKGLTEKPLSYEELVDDRFVK